MKKCFLGALLNPRKVKTTVLTLVIVNAWTVEIGQYYTDYSTALDDMNMMNEISPRRLIEYDRTVSKVTNIHAWTGPTVSTDRDSILVNRGNRYFTVGSVYVVIYVHIWSLRPS